MPRKRYKTKSEKLALLRWAVHSPVDELAAKFHALETDMSETEALTIVEPFEGELPDRKATAFECSELWRREPSMLKCPSGWCLFLSPTGRPIDKPALAPPIDTKAGARLYEVTIGMLTIVVIVRQDVIRVLRPGTRESYSESKSLIDVLYAVDGIIETTMRALGGGQRPPVTPPKVIRPGDDKPPVKAAKAAKDKK